MEGVVMNPDANLRSHWQSQQIGDHPSATQLHKRVEFGQIEVGRRLFDRVNRDHDLLPDWRWLEAMSCQT